jgi:hypothetical protein
MSNRLSSKQRQEIIDKWLNDEEDDDWEVFPLKEEGKFRVKRKIKPSQIKPEVIKPEVSENNARGSEIKPEVIKPEIQKHEIPAREAPQPLARQITKPEIKPKKSKTKNKALEQLTDTNIQILEHLKLLGEDAQRRNQKKELKHEVKYQVRLNPQYQNVIPTNPIPNPEVIIQYPSYTRRKINFSMPTY